MNLVLSEAGDSIDSGAKKLAQVSSIYLINHRLNAKVMILNLCFLRQNLVLVNMLKIKLVLELKLFRISVEFCIKSFSKILILLASTSIYGRKSQVLG